MKPPVGIRLGLATLCRAILLASPEMESQTCQSVWTIKKRLDRETGDSEILFQATSQNGKDTSVSGMASARV